MQFKGRKLLVVGGTSGIGLETAQMVAEQGGSVVIVGNRPEKAEAARQQLAAVSGEDKVAAYAVDLTDFASVQALIEKLAASHKDIDLMVNSAGIYYPKAFIEHSLEDYDNFLNLEPRDLLPNPSGGGGAGSSGQTRFDRERHRGSSQAGGRGSSGLGLSMAKIGLDTLTTRGSRAGPVRYSRQLGQPRHCGNQDLRALHPRRSVGWCAE